MTERRARAIGTSTAAERGVRGMTAFGSGLAERDGLRLTVEIKGFNNRVLDVRLRLPPEVASSEPELRRLLQERLVRGRVEATATLLAAGDGEGRLEIHDAVAAQYVEAARRLARRHRLGPAFPAAALLSLPGVVQMTGDLAADPARATELLRTAFAAALEAFDAGRRAEGTRLSADLRARLEAMERDVAVITSDTAREPDRLAARLRERLAPLLQDAAIDPARLAQEVALLADKVDISEELVRLGGYLEQARGLLEGRESPAGKMLDFVMQEMNRESNTIASKAEALPICQAALRLRSAVETIREQVQNLE
jgi:uncharacterized protein (TIGR00255 family)